VLAQPFNSTEVSRVMSMAWRRWQDDRKRSGGAAAKPQCLQ